MLDFTDCPIREVEHCPPFDLNSDQTEALDALHKFLQDPHAQYSGLFGAAGTGKTSVIGRLCDRTEKRIALSAPTHKAAGILADKSPSWIDCHTIHRLLGCRKYYDIGRGEVEFRPDDQGGQVGAYDVVVVDECSMIGDKMHSWIDRARKLTDWQDYTGAMRTGTKIIYLGDPYQLPPVKDGDKSPCFELGETKELHEIMRHKGVIQRACDNVREAMIAGKRPPLAKVGKDEHGEIRRFRNSEQGIADFFDHFLEDPQGSKALAFKNDDVDFMNGYVRKKLYGDRADKEPYIVGERLVLVTTYESPTSGGTYHTGTECAVESVEDCEREGLACLRLYMLCDDGTGFEAFAFGTKDQKRAYSKKIKDLKARAKRGTIPWRAYFAVKEAFARLRPGYATTIHKSQGSTYDRVFLLQSELVGIWDQELLARLLYVSYSRAKSELVLL